MLEASTLYVRVFIDQEMNLQPGETKGNQDEAIGTVCVSSVLFVCLMYVAKCV